MNNRKTASTINDAELDALYERLNDAEKVIAHLEDGEKLRLRAETELAALRAVARGYCPACGRGDAAPTVQDWEQQKQRADRAEAQLARLHEGEEPGYVEYAMATPGQWIWVWNRATPEERHRIVQAFLDDAAAASLCRSNGHAQRLEEDRKAWVIVARIRDVIADMDQITGARHWARILRKVVDGQEPVPAATQTTDHQEQP